MTSVHSWLRRTSTWTKDPSIEGCPVAYIQKYTVAPGETHTCRAAVGGRRWESPTSIGSSAGGEAPRRIERRIHRPSSEVAIGRAAWWLSSTASRSAPVSRSQAMTCRCVRSQTASRLSLKPVRTRCSSSSDEDALGSLARVAADDRAIELDRIAGFQVVSEAVVPGTSLGYVAMALQRP